MAKTPSRMVPLGTPAPEFSLTDSVSGETLELSDFSAPVLAVMFICNHCPFVKHINRSLVEVAAEYQRKGVDFVAISSNDIENYPEDSPERMRELAREEGYPFPYLFDESQQVAKSYGAECTPDFFVFDAERKLAYRGRFDGSSPGNSVPVDGSELSGALDALLSGQSPSTEQHPSIGCNIKWK